MDQHRNTDNLSSTNSPQLPDLLNGTEITKERQEIDKLNILKGLGEFNQVNNLQSYNNTSGGELLVFLLLLIASHNLKKKNILMIILFKFVFFLKKNSRKLGGFEIRNE